MINIGEAVDGFVNKFTPLTSRDVAPDKQDTDLTTFSSPDQRSGYTNVEEHT